MTSDDYAQSFSPADQRARRAVREALLPIIPGITEDTAGAWWRIGWTPAHIDTLIALARTLHEQNVLGMIDLRASFGRLVGLGHGGRPIAAKMMPWVHLAAGSPTAHEFHEISLMVKGEAVGGAAWVALGAIGPVAYAAGISLAEARLIENAPARVAALHTLAGLRGWPLLFPTNPAD